MPGSFLDTSVLAKLYHLEIGSDRIEVQSAFATKVRTGVIGNAALDRLRGLFFSDLAKGRFEVALPARRHLHNAATIIRNHAVDSALRTLDAR